MKDKDGVDRSNDNARHIDDRNLGLSHARGPWRRGRPRTHLPGPVVWLIAYSSPAAPASEETSSGSPRGPVRISESLRILRNRRATPIRPTARTPARHTQAEC